LQSQSLHRSSLRCFAETAVLSNGTTSGCAPGYVDSVSCQRTERSFRSQVPRHPLRRVRSRRRCDCVLASHFWHSFFVCSAYSTHGNLWLRDVPVARRKQDHSRGSQLVVLELTIFCKLKPVSLAVYDHRCDHCVRRHDLLDDSIVGRAGGTTDSIHDCS
jgi:hypothetical protein